MQKIHQVLKFDQKPWLKKYIDFNSERRKNATNEFEKMFYKLFNNAIYGKTIENERKHVEIKLVSRWEGRYRAEAYISRPNFLSCGIFDENCAAIQILKSEVDIKKPIYVGLTILDKSKSLVYRFHYDFMLKKLKDDCKLLYTDTDNLIYEVTICDIYKLMQDNIQEFDISDYPENNIYKIPRVNKNIVGLMKDKCNGNVILKFVGLRSKLYSVVVQNKNIIKRPKE